MKRLFSAIFGKGDAAESAADSFISDEEIPRYPPFAKGMPVAALDRVLETQQDLIGRIQHTLALSKEEFEKYVQPVLRNYAAYVHLLPASETHHHRGAGGLFRHGLEVAFWAAQSTEGIYFAYAPTPRERREQEPRWKLATCLAGLLHDIGKPASDLAVTSKNGDKEWNPYGETLFAWAVKNKIDRYYLRWRDGRHKRHEQFSVLVMDKIVPHETLQWLTKTGPEILQAMLEAISGSDENHVVASLVLRADNTSVEKDMKNHQVIQADGSLGVPVEKYILDAMRRLINNATWLINQKGARLWVLEDGPYVVWKHGAEDITRMLAQDRVPGIPRDPDTLADILIERNLAVPQKHENTSYRYWTVAPDELEQENGNRVKLHMLRLSSNDVLFSGEPPVATGAVIERINGEEIRSKSKVEGTQTEGGDEERAESVQENTDESADSKKSPSKPEKGNKKDDGGLDDVFGISSKPGGGGDNGPSRPVMPKSKKKPPESKPAGDDPFSGGEEAGDLDDLFDSKANKKDEDLNNALDGEDNDVQTKGDKPNNAERDETQGRSRKQNPSSSITTSANREKAQEWLDSLKDESGDAVRRFAEKVKSQPNLWGRSLNVAKGKVIIKYPDGAAALDKPPVVLSMLEKSGALELDPVTPMKKIRQVEKHKGLVLTAKASAAFLAFMPEGTEEPATSKARPKKSLPKQQPSKKTTPMKEPAPDQGDTLDDIFDLKTDTPGRQAKKKGAAKPTATKAAGNKKQKATKRQPQKSGNPKKEKQITPSASAVKAAQELVGEVRNETLDVRGGVLKLHGDLVVPMSALFKYARTKNVSVWEMRTHIDKIDGCELKEGKLFVKEKP